MLFRGACLCGQAHYETRGVPGTVVLCYCNLCRRSVGATPVAWVSFPEAEVQLEGVTYHQTSPTSRRGFCAGCGTSLTFQSQDYPGEIDLTLATLERPEALIPQHLCFVPKRLSWAPLDRHLPRHQGDTSSAFQPPQQSYEQAVLEVWQRALTQISLLALTHPERAQRLAEVLGPAWDWRDLPDATARLRERLEELARLYPDGAGWLSEGLGD
jgi:hypothetical protein